MPIRLRVKEIAEQKGISAAKLSRLSDVNSDTVYKMFREPYHSNNTLAVLEKVAIALGVSVKELFVEE